MITVDSLRNPARQSGFDHVGQNGEPSRKTRRYRGESGNRPRRGEKSTAWRGPLRATPEEAAQDYCDYTNGREVAAVAALKSAGHTYQNIYAKASDPEVEAALGVLRDAAAQRKGRPGFVYLISDGTAYKIGYSVNPEKRVAELQTGNPRVLSLVRKMNGTEADEKALHQKFIQYNLLQEWFRPMSEILAAFH